MPIAYKIDRSKLKIELEEFGTKLRLMCHFRNQAQSSVTDRFGPKSFFNPMNTVEVITASKMSVFGIFLVRICPHSV